MLVDEMIQMSVQIRKAQTEDKKNKKQVRQADPSTLTGILYILIQKSNSCKSLYIEPKLYKSRNLDIFMALKRITTDLIYCLN